MKLRDLVLLGATAVTALAALSACGTSAASPGPTAAAVPSAVSPAQLRDVTLRVGDQKGSGEQVLLRAAGLLDSIPYHVKWSTFTSGPPMLEAANDNAIDVGQVGNTPPIFSAAASGAIDIVAALRSGVGDAVLVPKDSGVRGLADLRGKKIAVAQGSSADGTLLNTLAKAGLKPADVSITYLQPADAYAAFTQGGVDAWAIWEPYVTEAVRNLGARTLVSGADALAAHLSNGLTFQVANRASLTDAGRNAAIADYVSRIARADQWARTHQDQWATIYAQQTGIPPAIAKAAVAGLVLTPIAVDDSVVAAEQKLADAFTAAGQIPAKVTVLSFVDRRYNTEIAPLLGSLNEFVKPTA
jgi:sulfonate transport system substrate-binding protein